MAYQVDPVVTETAEGTKITDFSVSGDKPGMHRGQLVGWENDLVEDSQGNIHHVMENVTLNEEEQGSVFDTDEYVSDLQSIYPDLNDALAWGGDHYPQHVIDSYNEALDSDDPAQFMPLLESMLEDYRQAKGQPEETVEEQEEESEFEWENMTPEEDAEFNKATDQLFQTEPAGDVEAEAWQEACEAAKESGDETYAAVTAAIAAFHAGEVGTDEAISYIMANYPMKDVQRVWRHLNS